MKLRPSETPLCAMHRERYTRDEWIGNSLGLIGGLAIIGGLAASVLHFFVG